MKQIAIARGFLQLCDTCYEHLQHEGLINIKDQAQQIDTVIDEICPNCSDFNRPLIDDMIGSAE